MAVLRGAMVSARCRHRIVFCGVEGNSETWGGGGGGSMGHGMPIAGHGSRSEVGRHEHGEGGRGHPGAYHGASVRWVGGGGTRGNKICGLR